MRPIRIELPTEFAAGSVNAYLFREPEPVLVDTGEKSDAGWAALEAGLAENGLSVRELRKVVISHPHVDHFGQAARIASESEATIEVSSLGKPWLTDFSTMWQKRLAYYRDSFLESAGYSKEIITLIVDYMEGAASAGEPVPANRLATFALDSELELGGRQWRVIHTPGHASHQTCFYQPETRQFLAADMLLAKTPTPIVERPDSGDQRIPALPQFLESLSLVEALEIDTVYPGHGRPFGDHRQLIGRQRARIQKRKGECLALIAGGVSTVVELVDTMYAHLPLQYRFAGLWMLVGYLDLLKADGSIEEEACNGTWNYRARQHEQLGTADSPAGARP